MSVEALAVSAVVERGASALRTLYAAGITIDNFAVYDDEMRWIESRLGRKKTLNRRVFKERFPDFEFVLPREDIRELAEELREESLYAEANQLVATIAEGLNRDNALDLLLEARDRISAITRAHAPQSHVDLDDYEHTIEQMRQGMILAKQGKSLGILTGINHIDHHLGGLMPGQFIEIVGRTGEGKSYFVLITAWTARKAANNVGVFTPEFSEHEVKCRYHTLASADKEVQAAVGLERSFRNRALMHMHGFNLKTYQRFCEYMREQPGRMHLLSGAGMQEQMSVSYIEQQIVELELDYVIVDPIYLLKPVRLTQEGNPYQETAWIAEHLHRLSEQYGVPIVFTNQAHLAGGREDAPHKDKSFGSKSLVHLADYVLGYMHISEENRSVVKGSKSRFGADNWRFDMDFFANTGVWRVTTSLIGSYYNGSDDGDEEAVRTIVKGKGKA